jgi:hypothetical protein
VCSSSVYLRQSGPPQTEFERATGASGEAPVDSPSACRCPYTPAPVGPLVVELKAGVPQAGAQVVPQHEVTHR